MSATGERRHNEGNRQRPPRHIGEAAGAQDAPETAVLGAGPRQDSKETNAEEVHQPSKPENFNRNTNDQNQPKERQMIKLPRIGLVAMLAILAIAATAAITFSEPATTDANTQPASDCAQISCASQWLDYWFDDIEYSGNYNRSVTASRYNRMPNYPTDVARAHNSDGETTHLLRLTNADWQYRFLPGYRWTSSVEWTQPDFVTGRSTNRYTFPNAGPKGLVQTRIIATFEVTANGRTYTTTRHYYDDVKYENPNGCRYWTQADGGGFWQVVGINDETQGGRILKYLSPEADNGAYCALNDWAKRDTNYHLQVCNSVGCTFPDGAPWRLSASDFRRSAFDHGIDQIESHVDDNYTGYSVSYGNGQTTFDMEVWPWIEDRFNNMTDYVVFARCTDLRCDVNTVLRGNQIDQYVTK